MAINDLANRYRDRLAPAAPLRTAPRPSYPNQIPTTRPVTSLSVRSVFTESWQIIRAHWLYLLILGLVTVLINFLPAYAGDLVQATSLVSLVISILGFLLRSLVTYGVVVLLGSLALGTQQGIVKMFTPNPRSFLSYLLATILISLALIPAFLLLIIPGVYLSVRTQFYPFVIAKQGMGPIKALKESWHLTKGRFWFLLLFALLGIVINFVASSLFVGAIIAMPVVFLLQAVIFKRLSVGYPATPSKTAL